MSPEEIEEKRQQYCRCFQSILQAYQEKLRENKRLRDELNRYKLENRKLKEQVQELWTHNTICNHCGKEIIPKLEDQVTFMVVYF